MNSTTFYPNINLNICSRNGSNKMINKRCVRGLDVLGNFWLAEQPGATRQIAFARVAHTDGSIEAVRRSGSPKQCWFLKTNLHCDESILLISWATISVYFHSALFLRDFVYQNKLLMIHNHLTSPDLVFCSLELRCPAKSRRSRAVRKSHLQVKTVHHSRSPIDSNYALSLNRLHSPSSCCTASDCRPAA